MNKDAYFSIPDTSGMDPLTVEQYNALSGRPVIVEKNTGKKWWAIAQSISGDTCGYGRFWWAYAYPPAHIDREAWESCPCCDAAKANSGVVNQALWVKEPEVNKWTLFGKKLEYCPICGRPLTEEAWSMLEKRLRGCNK